MVPQPRALSEEDNEEPEAVGELEADLFTAIRPQLGEEDEPGREGGFEPEGEAVVQQQPDEFLCSSCFQLKLHSQLADPLRVRCVDCVNNAAS